MSSYPKVIVGHEDSSGDWQPGQAGYDALNNAMHVNSMQKKWRDTFPGTALDGAKWESSMGTGQSVVVASNIMTLNAGATAAAEGWVRTVETFTVPFRVSIGLTLSQRLAANFFYVELISVDPTTLQPNGKEKAGWLFTGTTATNGVYQAQTGAGAIVNSSAVTVATTAAGSFFEIEAFADETWYHSGTIDNANGRQTSYRKQIQSVDPNAVYKVQIRALNSTAPASNTALNVNYLSITDYMELTAEVTAGRGNNAAGQALAVNVVQTITQPVNGTVTANQGTMLATSAASAVTTASTNATSVKATSGKLLEITVSNVTATAMYVKLYNKASAPTVGTDVPVLTIPVAAGATVPINFGVLGKWFGTGIAFAVTAAAAATDTGVTVAGAQIHMSYV